MKDFTQKSASAKVINSPDYQEYLEYLEEEAMSKNPDEFCFEKPTIEMYVKEDFDAFQYMDEQYNQGLRIISAAI